MVDISEKTSILYKLRQQASNAGLRPRTIDSFNFFIKRIKLLRSSLRKSPGFAKDSELLDISQVQSGMLVYFQYEAITESLKYFDAYPMTLIINKWTENGRIYMDGINFHYLPLTVRFRIMQKLIEKYNYWNMDNNVNKFTGVGDYYALKGLLENNGFGFSYKKYLLSQVQTNFYCIPLKYMDIALTTPTAQWQKGASDSSVWNDYIRKSLT